MSGDRFPLLGNLSTRGMYRTEPALRAGAELQQRTTLLVGQRSPDPDPKAAILLGKIMEQTPSKNVFSWSVWLDATFPHVMLIAGKRGSGKSYDLGIIAEGLCAPDSAIAFGTSDFAMILFDTQNQFWTLTRPPVGTAQENQLLSQWKIEACELRRPVVLRPRGTTSVASFEVEFSLRPSDLEVDDWTALCGLDRFTAMGQCLRAARAAMPSKFDIQSMIAWLFSEDNDRFGLATREAVAWRLEAVGDTELFDPDAEDVAPRLASFGSESVIQLAELDDATKSVVVAVIMRKLINWAGPAQRRKKIASMTGEPAQEEDRSIAPRIWVLIDEAHLVCPSDKPTAARPVIVDYVKRGRDAGLSLVLATQQPSALDTSIISQCDIVAVHKLTIDHDIEAATARMPARPPSRASKLPSSADISNMDELARALEAGQALFADAESSRAFILQSRPRISPHGGGEPEL